MKANKKKGLLPISIIIAAKNEARNLPWVVGKIRGLSDRLGEYEILVVDGHSIDETRVIARQLGCRVVFDHQKGKGEALRVGAKKARGEILLFIDAGGSHHPKDIPKLLKPILKDNFDHVSGSRMIAGSDELHKELSQFFRLMGSAIITLGINYMTIPETLSTGMGGFSDFSVFFIPIRLSIKLNESMTIGSYTRQPRRNNGL